MLKKSWSQRQPAVFWAVLLEQWVLLSTSEATPGTLWTFWKELSGGPQIWWRVWSTSHLRKGSSSWDCSAWKREGSGNFIHVYKWHTTQRGQGQPVSSGDWWQDSSGHKMKLRKLCLNIRIHFFQHEGDWALAQVTQRRWQFPSLQILQSCLFVVLGNHLQVALLE